MENFWLITGTLIFVFALAKFLVTTKCFTSGMEWPAGPRKFPIIGNLHQLGAGDLFHVWLAKLAKLHGGVFTIWVGSWHPVIIVSDINNAREVFVSKSSSYSARELVDRLKIVTADGKTVSESDSSPYWHKLKKGLQTPLNVTSQSHLAEEGMKNLIISMKENASQENGILKPLDYVKEESIRILSRPVFGKDFSNENFVVGTCHILEELAHRGDQIVSLADAFKIAEYLPSFKKSMRQLHAVKERIQNLIRPLMVSNPPTNTYLHFLSSQDYSEDLIVCAILEVYLLGVHSTAGTIVWALTFLVCEQKIQEKLYREIKNVTGGTKRSVKVEDLKELPYLQAVVNETLRMKTIAPLAISHVSSKETSLMGKRIDKGTEIMVNLYAIHHNPDVFPEPYKFIPERFLKDVNADGKYGDIKKMESSLLPFGAGMRICAGMDLAKLTIAFGIASLINEFKWDCVSDGKLPDLSENLGFLLLMKTPLEARIIPRAD